MFVVMIIIVLRSVLYSFSCINELFILCFFCFMLHWMPIFHIWNVSSSGYKHIFFRILIIFMQLLRKILLNSALQLKKPSLTFDFVKFRDDESEPETTTKQFNKSIRQWRNRWKLIYTRDPGDVRGELGVFILHKRNIPISQFIFWITAQNFTHNLKINLYYQHKNLKWICEVVHGVAGKKFMQHGIL